jgi:hypothetical protein
MVLGAIALAVLIQGSAPAVSPADILRQTADTVPASRSADSAATPAPRSAVLDARAVPAWGKAMAVVADTQPRRRRHAVSYSDWYYRRLQVHRWGSWLELPVFGTEYWLGQKLINDVQLASWVKPTHTGVAGVLGGLFTINTVTGLWNLYDSRHDTDDRALVWTHSALMLASDAGFAITGALGGSAKRAGSGRNNHRNVAIASMGLATAGTLLMWIKRGL